MRRAVLWSDVSEPFPKRKPEHSGEYVRPATSRGVFDEKLIETQRLAEFLPQLIPAAGFSGLDQSNHAVGSQQLAQIAKSRLYGWPLKACAPALRG